MIQSSSRYFSSTGTKSNNPPKETSGTNNGSVDETVSIISLHRELCAQSHTSEAESVLINGSMPPGTIITHLSQHGCHDLTSELDPQSISKGVVSTGGSGDVYRGTLYDGRRVGIKCLRVLIGMDKEGEKQVKRAARELYIWSKCKHPNIQELTGVALHDGRVAMISPWMKNGNLSWYISCNPDVDRYSLAIQVAAAVAYLRANGVVHGDIKAQNFLVSEDHIVKLTDFGSSIISLCSLRFTASSATLNVTLRWTAPEILLGKTRHTFEGDIYALGMTIMEIITGSIPWGRMLDVTVMHNLTQNACPPRPEAYMPVGHRPSDRLWELTKKCWASEPRQRPHPTKVRDELEKINKQYQSNSLTLMNTHRIPDNDKTPTGPVSNSVPASGELLASSSTQNTRKKWFEKLSSVKFGHSTNPTQNALKPEKVETVNAKLQRIFKIFQRRRLQHERTRERSKIMSAKRELILLSEHDEPGGQGDITAPRSPPHSIQSFITAPSPPPSIQILSRCESPVSLPCAFDDSTDPNLIPDEPRSRSPISNASSISISPSRRMLIIGSSYRDHAQVKRTFSFETLDGTVEDRNQLKSCFKARNYSVETLFEEGFNRKRALARVAQFLEDAERGDVRAIVFTGCGYTDGDGMVSLVPPECSEKSGAITRSEWDQNIRNHSHPGVIVFSIMAHCFSGDMMKQDLDHQSWDAPSSVDSGTGDGPIFITFAGSDKTAYESRVTRGLGFQLASSVDHFIYALIGAIHSIDVETGTWNQFFEAFEWHFQRARSCASWMDKPETPGWRLSNPQTPRFSASELIRLSAVF